MTAVVSDVQIAAATEDDIEHFVCCEVESDERTLTFCGKIEPPGPSNEVDEVECARCNVLERLGYCPLALDHVCTWGDTPAAVAKRLSIGMHP